MGNCVKNQQMKQVKMRMGSHKPVRVKANKVQAKTYKKIKYEQQPENEEALSEHKEENKCDSKGIGSNNAISTKGTDDLSGTMMEFFAGRNLEDLRQTDGKAIPSHNYENDSIRAIASNTVRQEPEVRNLEVRSLMYIEEDDDDDQEVCSPSCQTESPDRMIINFIQFLEKQTKKQLDFLSTIEFEQKVKAIQFTCKNPAQLYSFKRKLGNGGNCKVYLARERRCQDNIFAIRYMSGKNQSFISRVKKQIAVMEMCQSKYILRHHFTYLFNEYIYMFVEYMNAGSLFDFISHNKNHISEDIIAFILKQVLRGLSEVHKQHQIHRDIKSENILLNTSGEIKIGDFGAVAQLTKQMAYGKGFEGTILWMAPEIIKKQPYTQKIDIWSLGILTIELCTGSAPYQNLNTRTILRKIADEKPPTYMINTRSSQLQDFVFHCLQKKPENRWSCSQLLSHSFITEIKNQGKQREILKAMIANRKPKRQY